jgi:hypothetical protein
MAPDEPIELVRLRRVVSDHYVTLVLVFLLVGSVGAWAGYAPHVDPGTRTEERTVATWSRSGGFTHGATVTRTNPIYETGTELRDRRAYFDRIAPFLAGRYSFRYAASGGGDVTVDVVLRLRVRSRGEGTVFWGSTRELNTARTPGTAPDRTVAVDYEFNMSRARARIDRAAETIGNSPGDPEVLVEAETRMTGDVNGRPIDRTFVDQLRLVPDRDAFVVRSESEFTNSTARTESVAVPRTYSPIRRLGGPLVALVGFGGAVGLAVARRRELFALSQRDRDRLVRDEYDEWLSEGSLPPSLTADAEGVIELSALVDLVDVAVDTDGRVLYDPSRDLYAVPGESYTYICRPPLTDDPTAGAPAPGGRDTAPTAGTVLERDGDSNDEADADGDRAGPDDGADADEGR